MKKKYLVLLISLMITGCFFGEVGSGITSKTCTRETSLDGITLIEEKTIKQKDNELRIIVVTNKIVGEPTTTFKSLKNSYLSEIKNLQNLGIKTSVIDDVEHEYSVSYEFDLNTISDDLKEKYEFENLYHNQLKKYEQEGYKCE